MKHKRNYIPILKGKRGELVALKNLKSEAKSFFTPLIDIPRIELDFDTDPEGAPKEPLEGHLGKVGDLIVKAWKGDGSIYIDTTDLPLALRTTDGEHPIFEMCMHLLKNGVDAIPCIGFDRDEDYISATQELLMFSNGEVCLRLLREDLEESSELNDKITSLSKKLEIEPKHIHLLFDLQSISADDVENTVDIVLSAASEIENLEKFASFTVAGSAFPPSITGIAKGEIGSIPRYEVLVWREVKKAIARMPSFGDYGVVHPILRETDWRKVTLGGKIRYTQETEWVVVKGHSFKVGAKYQQYHQLSKQLSEAECYMGAKFSWGDEYVDLCARKKVSCGNLETWVKVDTNHHLTFVGLQIANEIGSSDKK